MADDKSRVVGSQGWLVTWTVDADEGGSPLEAARAASEVQRQQSLDGEDGSGVFEVKCKATGRTFMVDLEEEWVKLLEKGEVG